MNIIEKLKSLINCKNKLVCSKVTNISTKYGLLQIQAYKDKSDEYLVFMSREFFDMEIPVVCIHSNYHVHNDPNSNIRYASGGMDSFLKMISKEGGMVIYHTKDTLDMDMLLQSINARKLENKQNKMTNVKIPLTLKVYGREYQIIGTILKNLNLPVIQLVSHDINLTLVIESLGIDIFNTAEAISYNYGDIK